MTLATEITLATELGELLLARRWTITTAESCTGGLIAAAITEIAGSSGWFEQGVVSYANAAKSRLLGVEPALIDAHGAVSEAVVLAMASGAQSRTGADVAVAVSGVAGPSGGTREKPVGTVWLGWWVAGTGAQATCFHFDGDRRAIREAALQQALRGTIARIKTVSP